MSEQEEVTMVNLTDMLKDGLLVNPKEDALYNAETIKEQGPLTLTIAGFQKRQFINKGKTETAWIMLFEQGGPGLKLNMTNQESLYQIMGTANIGEMIGRPITLYHDPNVMFGGKKIGGIRLERAEDLVGK